MKSAYFVVPSGFLSSTIGSLVSGDAQSTNVPMKSLGVASTCSTLDLDSSSLDGASVHPIIPANNTDTRGR